MSEFKNVTVVKKANVYFNGGVTSRTVIFADGTKKTLGICMPGEYEFTTGVPEVMEFMAGELEYRIGDSGEWKKISGSGSFDIPANTKFTMKIKTIADYCCSFA